MGRGLKVEVEVEGLRGLTAEVGESNRAGECECECE